MKKQSSVLFFIRFISFFVPVILSYFFSEKTSVGIFFILAIFILFFEWDIKEPVDIVRAFPVFVPLLIFAACGFYSIRYDEPITLSRIDSAVLCYTCLYSLVLLFISATNGK